MIISNVTVAQGFAYAGGILLALVCIALLYGGLMALYKTLRKHMSGAKFFPELITLSIVILVNIVVKFFLYFANLDGTEQGAHALSFEFGIMDFFRSIYSSMGNFTFEGIDGLYGTAISKLLQTFYYGSTLLTALVFASVIVATASYEAFSRLSLLISKFFSKFGNKKPSYYIFTALTEETILLAESIKKQAEENAAMTEKDGKKGKKKADSIIIFAGPALDAFDRKNELCRRVMANGFLYWSYNDTDKSIVKVLNLNVHNGLDSRSSEGDRPRLVIFSFNSKDHVPEEEENMDFVFTDVSRRIREAKTKNISKQIDSLMSTSFTEYYVLTEREVNYQAYQFKINTFRAEIEDIIAPILMEKWAEYKQQYTCANNSTEIPSPMPGKEDAVISVGFCDCNVLKRIVDKKVNLSSHTLAAAPEETIRSFSTFIDLYEEDYSKKFSASIQKGGVIIPKERSKEAFDALSAKAIGLFATAKIPCDLEDLTSAALIGLDRDYTIAGDEDLTLDETSLAHLFGFADVRPPEPKPDDTNESKEEKEEKPKPCYVTALGLLRPSLDLTAKDASENKNALLVDGAFRKGRTYVFPYVFEYVFEEKAEGNMETTTKKEKVYALLIVSNHVSLWVSNAKAAANIARFGRNEERYRIYGRCDLFESRHSYANVAWSAIPSCEKNIFLRAGFEGGSIDKDNKAFRFFESQGSKNKDVLALFTYISNVSVWNEATAISYSAVEAFQRVLNKHEEDVSDFFGKDIHVCSIGYGLTAQTIVKNLYVQTAFIKGVQDSTDPKKTIEHISTFNVEAFDPSSDDISGLLQYENPMSVCIGVEKPTVSIWGGNAINVPGYGVIFTDTKKNRLKQSIDNIKTDIAEVSKENIAKVTGMPLGKGEPKMSNDDEICPLTISINKYSVLDFDLVKQLDDMTGGGDAQVRPNFITIATGDDYRNIKVANALILDILRENKGDKQIIFMNVWDEKNLALINRYNIGSDVDHPSTEYDEIRGAKVFRYTKNVKVKENNESVTKRQTELFLIVVGNNTEIYSAKSVIEHDEIATYAVNYNRAADMLNLTMDIDLDPKADAKETEAYLQKHGLTLFEVNGKKYTRMSISGAVDRIVSDFTTSRSMPFTEKTMRSVLFSFCKLSTATKKDLILAGKQVLHDRDANSPVPEEEPNPYLVKVLSSGENLEEIHRFSKYLDNIKFYIWQYWCSAQLWEKESNMSAYMFGYVYKRLLHQKQAQLHKTDDDVFSFEDLLRILNIEHQRWMRVHMCNGWSYGAKVKGRRIHNCLLPLYAIADGGYYAYDLINAAWGMIKKD